MIHYNKLNEIIRNSLDESLLEPIFTESKENESHITLTSDNSNSSQICNNLLNHLFFGKEGPKSINKVDEEEKTPYELNNLYYVKQPEKRKKGTSINKFVVKKQRGRVKVKVIDHKKQLNFIKIHDKNTIDNVLRKIQGHYISFIVLYINDILKNLDYKEQFYKLDYIFKRNIKKEFIDSLKMKNIGEILCNKISHKYKKDEKTNRYIFDKIIKKKSEVNKVLFKILSENYLEVFWKIYYKNCKVVNLKEYGLDKEILLSDKVKNYKDLLKENEDDINKEYKKYLNNCVELKFKIPGK